MAFSVLLKFVGISKYFLEIIYFNRKEEYNSIMLAMSCLSIRKHLPLNSGWTGTSRPQSINVFAIEYDVEGFGK
jgi:hypothetical protein